MSGVLKTVGAVASIIALIPGPWQGPAAIVAVVANVGAAVTAHSSHPPAQGSATRVTIGANQPMPYAIGRTFVGGQQVHDVGYGGTVSGVPNPYSSTVFTYSLGPVQSIEAFQADFTTISFSGGNATGYYAGFMSLATQLGACPESAALAGPHGTIPGWGASYKLSGLCAGLWTCNFDKKGKVFASGFPSPGVILEGVYVYDARQDSTYPGGSGACRALTESTYVGGDAAENPSCHAVTYALGRFQNGVKVFGPAFPVDAIDLPAFVAWANVCDANGWKAGGLIYEGPGISRWDNLKRICAAGAAEPCFVGGLLSVRYSAPKTSLDTITAADLADGECQVQGMKTWRQRLNGIVPKYRSEDHQWEYVQSDEVTSSTYVTEDGEEKSEERQYDLCQDKDQAAQLAAYDLVNGRELGPFVLPLKPRLLPYLIGEALTVNIPEMGLTSQLCTITGRKFDPGKAIVTLTFETETTAKHAFALGQTGTAPPTPSLVTGQDMDGVLSTTSSGNRKDTKFKRSVSKPATPTDDDPAGWSDGVPAGTDTIWQIVGTKSPAGALIGLWSTPNSITGLNPRGTYVGTDTYYLNNTVLFNGGSYIALQDGFSGQAPSGTGEATAYWDVLAAPGSAGAPGTPPGSFSATINLTSGSAVNLRTVANANGYTGASDATITFNVPSGVTIRGLSGSGIGIDTGNWPTSTYSIALTLVVQSGGIVDGGGGIGGDGGGGDGGDGGDAIYCRIDMSGGVTINSGGTVRGGGAGGGGGGSALDTPPGQPLNIGDPYLGGGGGGGGAPNGAGGVGEAGDVSGSNGSAGTTSGGGNGGGGAGGSYHSGQNGGHGGSFASAGTAASGAGGAAGFAVRKNGFTVSVSNSGTMTGSAA